MKKESKRLHKLNLCLLGCLLLVCFAQTTFAEEDFTKRPAQASAKWTELLDKDLSNWEVWTGVPHTEGAPVKAGKPVGLGDPKGLFKVIADKNGKSVLSVSGEVYGGLTTKKSFSNYHLSLMFKWGEKKWAPRLDVQRDSGIMYHCYGSHGAIMGSWKRSMEMQILEGYCGDFISLGPSVESTVTQAGLHNRWDPENGKTKRVQGRIIRKGNYEKANGEWNHFELYAFEDKAVHRVNGNVVMILEGLRLGDKPHTSGQIQLQSEGAQCFDKEIKIRKIRALPERLNASEAGWDTLFNGKDIEGWESKGGVATYAVEDGCIVGTTAPNTPNTFLCPPKMYGDFELTFEVKCDPDLNSGVQIRSISDAHEIPVGMSEKDAAKARKSATRESLFGPQVEIAADGNAGAVWFEGVGGWLVRPKPTITNKVYQKEGWNRYRVLAEGQRIQVWINGTQISDNKDNRSHFTKGRLGFQVHGIGGKPNTYSVRWKNIKIRNL
ncbi:DUF1080 domain-containing protein [Lentisphaera profundi]|uniref:DUF1080 domain-containing protein n=1 Tax=Lentisphaera profundi TaxID=1658616 RepID=A0ABY7VWW8_9BACT|nr:DUF1080 domain-containing protein [Lentisphaera profundi]WDE97301.1 DUF1080 domain-containing protein [Lentisphaera profundi]